MPEYIKLINIGRINVINYIFNLISDMNHELFIIFYYYI